MRGIDLKLKRVYRNVTARALAAEMGVSAARVGHIETRAIVTAEAEARYLKALDKFPTRDQAA